MQKTLSMLSRYSFQKAEPENYVKQKFTSFFLSEDDHINTLMFLVHLYEKLICLKCNSDALTSSLR